MGQSPVDKIIESRRAANSNAATPVVAAPEEDKFSLILAGDRMEEHFLELRFRTGLKVCFGYGDLIFITYDPDAGSLDLDFGGYLVTVTGRNLGGRVFDGIRHKRVVWLKESDSEMQDHKENELFISGITITPPGNANEEQAAAA